MEQTPCTCNCKCKKCSGPAVVVVRSGFLTKKPRNVAKFTWDRRYFVLTDVALYFFENEPIAKAWLAEPDETLYKRMIPLRTSEVKDYWPSRVYSGVHFSINPDPALVEGKNADPLEMYGTKAEAEAWIHDIRTAKAALPEAPVNVEAQIEEKPQEEEEEEEEKPSDAAMMPPMAPAPPPPGAPPAPGAPPPPGFPGLPGLPGLPGAGMPNLNRLPAKQLRTLNRWTLMPQTKLKPYSWAKIEFIEGKEGFSIWETEMPATVKDMSIEIEELLPIFDVYFPLVTRLAIAKSKVYLIEKLEQKKEIPINSLVNSFKDKNFDRDLEEYTKRCAETLEARYAEYKSNLESERGETYEKMRKTVEDGWIEQAKRGKELTQEEKNKSLREAELIFEANIKQNLEEIELSYKSAIRAVEKSARAQLVVQKIVEITYRYNPENAKDFLLEQDFELKRVFDAIPTKDEIGAIKAEMKLFPYRDLRLAERFAFFFAQQANLEQRIEIAMFGNDKEIIFEGVMQQLKEIKRAIKLVRESAFLKRASAILLHLGNYFNAGTRLEGADGIKIQNVLNMVSHKSTLDGAVDLGLFVVWIIRNSTEEGFEYKEHLPRKKHIQLLTKAAELDLSSIMAAQKEQDKSKKKSYDPTIPGFQKWLKDSESSFRLIKKINESDMFIENYRKVLAHGNEQLAVLKNAYADVLDEYNGLRSWFGGQPTDKEDFFARGTKECFKAILSFYTSMYQYRVRIKADKFDPRVKLEAQKQALREMELAVSKASIESEAKPPPPSTPPPKAQPPPPSTPPNAQSQPQTPQRPPPPKSQPPPPKTPKTPQ